MWISTPEFRKTLQIKGHTMNKEDWPEILELIQKHLRDIGHHEIADPENYRIQSGNEQVLPEPKGLAIEMLQALRRDIAARSENVVEQSLSMLAGLIDHGEIPKQAVIHDARGRAESLDDSPGTRVEQDLVQLIENLIKSDLSCSFKILRSTS